MPAEPQYKKYAFVCENKRQDDRPACGQAGTRLTELLREIVKEEQLGADVRICRSGCLDDCERGPNILIEPDHKMFHRVEDEDLPKILECLRGPKNVAKSR